MNESKDAPGISGRRVTIIVLVGLALVGGWLSYTLWSYSRIDAARAATDKAWLSLADQLSNRYRQIEKVIAEGVDAREIKMEYGEQFRLAVDRFRTTAQPKIQFATARELEQLLSDRDPRFELPPTPDELKSGLKALNACLEAEQSSLASAGGEFLSTFLKFDEPIQLSLAN